MASLSEEILRGAIQTEIRARDFYSRLADQIQNRRGRRKINALSRNEEHHKKMLEKRFRSLLGREYDPSTDQDKATGEGAEDPNGLVENGFSDKASALHVVSLAIALEDKAARFYAEQLNKVDDPIDVRLLERLVRFETRHKVKLQNEYDRLNITFNWIS